MTDAQFVSLSEVAEVESGAGFPLQYQGKDNERFPFLKVSDMNLTGNERCIYRWNNSVSEETRIQIRARALLPGTVIFPKIGAAIATNKKRILTKPSCVDNNVMGATPKPDRLVSEYLYHLLCATDLSQFASTSNPPSIRKSEVENWMVRIPSLEEQRRIVGLLNRAAEIGRRADDARAKARAIVPALFLDMFGDPATNPKRWPVTTVGKLMNVELRNGISPSKSGTLTGKVLTLSAITRGAFDPSAYKESLFTAPLVPEQSVSRSSFLICRGNGNPELVGRGAFPTVDMPDTAFPDTMIALRRVSGELCSSYLSALWATDFMRSQVKAAAKTTNGTYKISQGGILSFEVTLPPLPLQTAFAEQARRVEATARALDAAAAKAEAMAAALSAEVFG